MLLVLPGGAWWGLVLPVICMVLLVLPDICMVLLVLPVICMVLPGDAAHLPCAAGAAWCCLVLPGDLEQLLYCVVLIKSVNKAPVTHGVRNEQVLWHWILTHKNII